MTGEVIDGLVAVDKPAGWTSHDVVARCRRIFNQKKVGHSGTLDPDATGVLLVGLGRVTRLLRFLTELPKSYTGEVVLGVATSTLDAAGDETGRWDMAAVTVEQARTAARTLTGPIEQVPPMVSAVQIGGKRLHDLARQGIEVDRPPRPVEVYKFSVDDGPAPGVLAVEVECSSGTYVRTLAADLGTALGGGAHLRNLRRTAIGSFAVADAHSLDELERLGPAAVLTPAEALRDYPSLVVDDEGVMAVGFGRVLPADRAEGRGPWRVLDGDGRLLGMYERGAAGVLSAAVVVAPA
ncbi:MAG: tRNA pseudouridine55 synthase [Actinomycetota bacterium]|nr:tRNA pseudouridine55 synthase [Actinomycetota bacterium]